MLIDGAEVHIVCDRVSGIESMFVNSRYDAPLPDRFTVDVPIDAGLFPTNVESKPVKKDKKKKLVRKITIQRT